MTHQIKSVNALRAPEIQNIHNVSARELHATEHVQVVMVTLQPGEALKLHVTPVDVFFYGLEGEGVVEIGDARTNVTPDLLIESPARIPHRLFNESYEVFRFLVVKTPRPDKPTKIL